MKVFGKTIRLKNRRVFLGRFDDGAWHMEFKRLGDVAKGEKRVHVTPLAISDEAMRALIHLYMRTPPAATTTAWTVAVDPMGNNPALWAPATETAPPGVREGERVPKTGEASDDR